MAAVRDHSNKKMGNSTEFPGDAYDTSPGDFANLMEFFVKQS